MKTLISDLKEKFNIEGDLLGYEILKSGHINTTLVVKIKIDDKIKEYVFQKINKYVFKKPDEVMENISNVTNFIKNKLKSRGESTSRKVLKFYPSQSGKYYSIDDKGDYWRVYKFVNNSISFNETENLEILEETGKAFGEFQQLLDGFPIKNLNIIIPHFHNTVDRYRIFKEITKQNPIGRVDLVKNEINAFLNLEQIATKMYKMQKQGLLKLRVTHNDTKCNNVLFNEENLKHLCVIDLDTIMPGLIGFDFGDAVRFGANTSSEDEIDLDKVGLDFNKFKALSKGFISQVGTVLSKEEKDTLALGAITMTTECGLRFLTDYINGDKYFKIEHPDHNLDRARCQLKLAQDMIQNHKKMQEIIDQYCNIYSLEE